MTKNTDAMDTVLANIAHDLAALPSDDTIQRQLDDNRVARARMEGRVTTIRNARRRLEELAPQIAAEQKWRDHLIAWRQTLCDELLALPRRIRDERLLGVQTNITRSIRTIDRGLDVLADGSSLGGLRLGDLMKEAGYLPAPPAADTNQAFGQMPWHGALPEVERRLKALEAERDEAQRRLDDALLSDAERARREAARLAAFNNIPQRCTRPDGSQYDHFPTGRDVEIEAALAVPAAEQANVVEQANAAEG